MWRQKRTVNSSKCIFVSFFIIWYAVNVEVNCGTLDERISVRRGPQISKPGSDCPTLLANGCHSTNSQVDDFEEFIGEGSVSRLKRSKASAKGKKPKFTATSTTKKPHTHRPTPRPRTSITERPTKRPSSTHRPTSRPWPATIEYPTKKSSTRRPVTTTKSTTTWSNTGRTNYPKWTTTASTTEGWIVPIKKNNTLGNWSTYVPYPINTTKSTTTWPNTGRTNYPKWTTTTTSTTEGWIVPIKKNNTLGNWVNTTKSTTTWPNTGRTNYPNWTTTTTSTAEGWIVPIKKNNTLGNWSTSKKPPTGGNSTDFNYANNTSMGKPYPKLNITGTTRSKNNQTQVLVKTGVTGGNSTNAKNGNNTTKTIPTAPEMQKTKTNILGSDAKSATPPPIGFKYTTTAPGALFPLAIPPYKSHPEGPHTIQTSTHNPAGYGLPPPARGVTINIVTNNHIEHNQPTYRYSRSDVGSDSLGFYLGYSLGRIRRPTYYMHSGFYDGYKPRYDHYEVHHYFHNSDTIPRQSTIDPIAIQGCVGDSSIICPSGTTSLCLNNGGILCVASVKNTVRCTEERQGTCVNTIVPCVEGSVNCKVGTSTTMTIPCISTAKVPGNVTYVNNTIIVNQTTIINNVVNNNNSSTGNGTITGTNSTSVIHNGTNLSIFTKTIGVSVSAGTRSKRNTPPAHVNDFCVTIVAMPAKRKPNSNEIMVKEGTSILSKFLVRVLGI